MLRTFAFIVSEKKSHWRVLSRGVVRSDFIFSRTSSGRVVRRAIVKNLHIDDGDLEEDENRMCSEVVEKNKILDICLL